MLRMIGLAGLMLAASSVNAQDLGGIRLGMPEQEALRALRAFGAPTPLGGATVRGYRAGDYNFVLCRGSVDNVNHRLQRSFMAFVRTAERARSQYGEPHATDFGAEETDEPIGSMLLTWRLDDNSQYTLSYIESAGHPYSGETISHVVPCNRR